MEDNFEMRVKVTQTGKDLKITLNKHIKLNELKSLCIEELHENIPFQLIYHGKILKDTENLSFLNPDDLLFLVRESKKNKITSPVSQINLIVHPPQINQLNQVNIQLPGNEPNLLSYHNESSNPTDKTTGLKVDSETVPFFGKLLTKAETHDIISNSMKMISSNPQYREMIFKINPILRSSFQNNPLIEEMLFSPLTAEFLNNFFTSSDFQQNISENNFEQLMNNLGEQESKWIESLGPQILLNRDGSANSEQNLREKYAQELQQIINMGFTDEEAILKALESTNGDVFIAIENL